MYRCPRRPTTQFSDALALRRPRRHRSPLGARERKTLFCRLGRWNARVDVFVVVPGDTDCIVALAALQRKVSDALALRRPQRHRSPLGAQERKILRCRLERRNARVDVTVVGPINNDCIGTAFALQCRVSDALALRAPGGIRPFSARGEGRRSFAALDAGMLALM